MPPHIRVRDRCDLWSAHSSWHRSWSLTSPIPLDSSNQARPHPRALARRDVSSTRLKLRKNPTTTHETRTKRQKKKKKSAARGNVAIPTTTRWRRRPLAALGSRFGAQCMLSSSCLQQGEERPNKARKCREDRFSSRSWVVWPDVALRLSALLTPTGRAR